jgi:hypothetical protein
MPHPVVVEILEAAGLLGMIETIEHYALIHLEICEHIGV